MRNHQHAHPSSVPNSSSMPPLSSSSQRVQTHRYRQSMHYHPNFLSRPPTGPRSRATRPHVGRKRKPSSSGKVSGRGPKARTVGRSRHRLANQPRMLADSRLQG
ncbi:hypothetical protein K505DRAFT_328189 [Melanomma pulvis-pyrius CBS 109.77]|uniref:Uncharacterized protein n=1 Tax=Melanomma pulvis-pyrius CBS 109.77 TaxID=1314802 RepID=A0A6A6WZX8_9PLEO|nr:hypothetical protein K505DRAFT_328189 [Melanomma pulvis-pyrius CBS 109.77]